MVCIRTYGSGGAESPCAPNDHPENARESETRRVPNATRGWISRDRGGVLCLSWPSRRVVAPNALRRSTGDRIIINDDRGAADDIM